MSSFCHYHFCLILGWGSLVLLGCNTSSPEKKNHLPQTPASVMCSGCFTGQQCENGGCRGEGTISVARLHSMLPSKKFQLINVLNFEWGTIPGTDAQIPFNRIDKLIKHIGPDRGQLVVLYCRSIPKARIASSELTKKGYRNVVVVMGGLKAWKKAGYALKQ